MVVDMMKAKTDKNKTYEILGGYLMDNNHINIESLADEIMILSDNTKNLYFERFNTRRKIRNIAINELMFFIDTHLNYFGYPGYYATSKQVIDFSKEHGGDIEKVLDIVEKNIEITRKECE